MELLGRILNAFSDNKNEFNITYNETILEYWWECFRLIQIYRYLYKHYSSNDLMFRQQLEDAVIHATKLQSDIIHSTNLLSSIKDCVCFNALLDFMRTELNPNNDNSNLKKTHNTALLSHSTPIIPSDTSNMPWYRTFVEENIKPKPQTMMGFVEDGNISTRHQIFNQTNDSIRISIHQKMQDWKLYSNFIFLAYFYCAQQEKKILDTDSSATLACVNKIEHLIERIHSQELKMRKYMTTDECEMILMFHFHQDNPENGIVNEKMIFPTVTMFLTEQKAKFMQCVRKETNRHNVAVYNIETFSQFIVTENVLDHSDSIPSKTQVVERTLTINDIIAPIYSNTSTTMYHRNVNH
jgi:hypothetical protein